MIASIHRPTVARVDLGAIAGNIQAIQSRLPDQTQTWAVVKANAYGHGAVPVASHIRQLVDGFCVSNMDEALELRQAGLTEAILILGVVLPDQLGLAIEHDLTLTISSLDWFDLAKAEREDWTGLKVHLKVDTGMGRLGLRQLEDINYLLTRLPQLGAEVEGIFTHFATADEADQTQFQKQYQTFCQILDQLVYRPALVHASNSATSIWHEETVFSAVRLGISIYGLNPSGDSLPLPLDLKPALTLQSALVQVKELGPGQTVGYGGTYRTKGQEIIGTVPIGYADGWTRDRQDFQVLVNGEFCPIVGRVSMDQLTIRLPKAYPLGTRVTLIGQDGDKEITATDLAKHCQTINYEILCLLSDRVPRNYQ